MDIKSETFDQTDLQKQLQQSQEDADRLHQQLQEKDGALKRLQENFEEQSQEKAKLQEDHDSTWKWGITQSSWGFLQFEFLHCCFVTVSNGQKMN